MARASQQIDTTNLRSLLFSLLGGPVTWALYFLAAYLLVEAGCQTALFQGSFLGITTLAATVIVVTIVALLIVLYAGSVAYRTWQQMKRNNEDKAGEEGTEGHRQFMAQAGIGLSIIFGLLIILSGIPAVLLRPCAT